ncbi:unnamed protein product [Rotaria sordida]|uniref:Uncharacterized protein n=1 Tax=Rotaria sordida TaxID=392033 RepID=A0A814QCY2_9BILA|nr:unnamed protein product [Rotaria sordida]CAF1271140.1 unnamed protein product [Rotaria sordida]CAF1333358.1 unnamed protein product [Rotaria sordida]CAF3622459.1 unnamed protein product [Rotaria sordida]
MYIDFMILYKQSLFILFVIVFLLINYCFGRLNYSTIHCLIGPNFWCLNETTEFLCDINNKSIGLCGLTNKRCQIKTGDIFCKSSSTQQQSPFEFNGGLTGVNDNYFSYYILGLYWPPSSCPLIYNETKDLLNYFCSPYTNINQPGSERLVLHGLWPTFSTYGNYQGWPQFCSSTYNDLSYCHIDGNLCPWKNTTQHDFTQGHYEYCLSMEHIEQCLVNGTQVLEPEYERLKILAPGYLNKYNLFINHEWTKHGSCCSSTFNNNISNYLTHMLDLTDMVTRPGSLTYEYIQRYAGEKIGLTYLISMLNQTAIINCNSKCELEEIWICINRNHHTGLPNESISCPLGARNTSDSCKKARCEYVFIPLRNKLQSNNTGENSTQIIWIKFILIIFIFTLLKLVFFFCGGFYAFFYSF